MPKADDLVGYHIAADHAIGQPRLERLIDNASVVGKVSLALVS